MTKRKQQVSDDNLTVSRTNKRSKQTDPTYGEETGYFCLLPFDLINNILSRLPMKSIAQFRSLSKLWSSMIRGLNNNQLCPIESPAQPRLLLAIEVAGEAFFYSSLLPQNPDHNSTYVATLHHRTSGRDFYKLCRPIRGLVFRQHVEKKYSKAVICNPITGQSLTLPKLRMEGIKSERVNGKAKYSFGYDPIEKQFKVLRITWLSCSKKTYRKHQVLTLGTKIGKPFWRNIECCTIHYPQDEHGICINGVLYYPATINWTSVIVCFGVRSEKFSFINIDQDMASKILSMIDYNGKLGVCNCDNFFELWVLEDADKHKWSKHIYQIPNPGLKITGYVCVAGMIDSGEIVLCPIYTRGPFFVFYYNLERNIITRVRVEAPIFGESKDCRVYIFPNYVEEVMTLKEVFSSCKHN